MRVRVGETVELVNGKGALATAKVHSLEKKRAGLTIQESTSQFPSLPQILLGIPYLRPSKLEWILEKGTELGADSFLLYPAESSEKRDLSESQLERLQNLLVSAMKQSGRLFLPHLELLSSFSELLQREAKILFGDTRKGAAPFDEVPFPVLFITGPESGFSEEEQTLLEQKGTGVQLNLNILRAETAPIAAISLLAWKRLKI
jgi:16S rRNA (uracil1498-N3)-methyltransferase